MSWMRSRGRVSNMSHCASKYATAVSDKPVQPARTEEFSSKESHLLDKTVYIGTSILGRQLLLAWRRLFGMPCDVFGLESV